MTAVRARSRVALGGALLALGFVLLLLAVWTVWPYALDGVPPGRKALSLGLTLVGIIAGGLGLSAVAARTKGLIPALIAAGLALIAVEALLRAYGVPPGLIPTPTRVMQALWNARSVLLQDARVTFVQETLVGYLCGAVLGILVALAAVRFPFLERGALPYAGLFSSIPIVALAPVIVKAFGLEWTSKAIIVAVTVFFPVVVNVVRGLQSANPLLLDLMRTYAVTPAQAFALVRVPSALPFLFNALKIASTLAMIGAIVGEFFGTEGRGLGFRIQIEAGRFNLDIVWAAIVVASVLGIAFYAIIQWIEHRYTGWHASRRTSNGRTV
ncbi:ABC transporter permease [Deinococcus koreensis]|uniref:ABC transporter permease n=1 Tax=Deinococcus koreensis TaxID=2054903 RepID=A0A2K3UT76_9DEIO|nr:ABC transporter permease [Deinococcus koreensis]PNY79743.1 ABC transporter permease [Deinococcus koreensis]